MTDEQYMKRALALAKKGCGWTNPNPMVGAVIVKNGEIIGEGWHERWGKLHAERNALKHCTESPEGATLYVTLEPCCHYGKTPPCTEAIVESKIARVVIGSGDPNSLVCGKGVEILRAQKIEVVEHVLKEECDRLNEVFFHFIRTKRPYVVMKYAMTMDGKIATCTGASQWITGEKAREQVQRDRHRYQAIMVGVGTVLSDDPMLTCRRKGGRNPIRIICDTKLRTPLSSKIVQSAGKIRTIFATGCREQEKQQLYLQAGCEVEVLPLKQGQIDLAKLMDRLGELGIDSVLLEGGGTLNWSALEQKIVQKIQCYIAPKLFGGSDAKSPVEGRGVAFPREAFFLEQTTVTPFGEDVLIEGEVHYLCLQES